jgi:hypothetical protein
MKALIIQDRKLIKRVEKLIPEINKSQEQAPMTHNFSCMLCMRISIKSRCLQPGIADIYNGKLTSGGLIAKDSRKAQNLINCDFINNASVLAV